MSHRSSDHDVTNTVRVSDPRDVAREVCRLVRARYPEADLRPVLQAFETFTRIYSGTQPGYHGCDTWYHDAQHSLDCTLAMARLLDGYERSAPRSRRLGERRVRLGIMCALFHDVGYVRRHDDTARKGAELTLCHVTRSGEFLEEFLPTVGFAREARLARDLTQFTGYERPLEAVPVHGARDRRLGFLLGTADLVAQMADRNYPEKCRTFLYHEFEACGLAGAATAGRAPPAYASPEELLRKTPAFAEKLFAERLDGYFERSYRYLDAHFGDGNPYLAEIRKHLDYITTVVTAGDFGLLRRKPQSVNAHALRGLLGIRLGDVRTRPAGLLPTPLRRMRARGGAGAPIPA